MDDVQRLGRMAIALGLLTLFAMALSVPALSDIAAAEADLDMEWATLRSTGLLMLMFIALSIVTIRRAMKYHSRS